MLLALVRRRSLLALALLVPLRAQAQPASRRLEVEWGTSRNPPRALLAADLDDDDDDGVPDALAEQQAAPPSVDDELQPVTLLGAAGARLSVRTEGPMRLWVDGSARSELVLEAPAERQVLYVFGVAPSRAADDAALVLTSGGATLRVPVTVVHLGFTNGDNALLFGHRDAAGASHRVTNDGSLPRSFHWAERAGDVDNLRVELWDPGASTVASARVESRATGASTGLPAGTQRGALEALPLEAPGAGLPLRSRFFRLVGDEVDLHAAGVLGQTLLVGLRDRLRVRYTRAGVAGEASADLRVGRPGNEDGPLAARRARLRVVVLRERAGGPPLVGVDEEDARRVGREQVTIANELYLQCAITFGSALTTTVEFADPPRRTLLAIGDDDGLWSRGGALRFRVGGRLVGPLLVPPGWRPTQTAEALASLVRRAGFEPTVTTNRRTDYGAEGSADLQVRDARGRLLELTPDGELPLSTDPQQTARLGSVDLADGIEEFNNLNSAAGTLEERTLLKSVMDADPSTIDLVFINRFTHATRIGEAFVRGDGAALFNTLLIDRAGLAAQRDAWTQSHEMGHLLLNQPWHPDNMGPDRPWLLMDADASLGAVNGPKRLLPEDCARIAVESGPGSPAPLLQPYDLARPSPRAASLRAWPSAPLYPRAVPGEAAVVEARPAENLDGVPWREAGVRIIAPR